MLPRLVATATGPCPSPATPMQLLLASRQGPLDLVPPPPTTSWAPSVAGQRVPAQWQRGQGQGGGLVASATPPPPGGALPARTQGNIQHRFGRAMTVWPLSRGSYGSEVSVASQPPGGALPDTHTKFPHPCHTDCCCLTDSLPDCDCLSDIISRSLFQAHVVCLEGQPGLAM